MNGRENRRNWIAGGAGLLLLGGFGAHAANMSARPAPQAALPDTPVVEAIDAAPGTTGSMALPDAPEATLATAPTGVVAAQPFHPRGSAIDRSRALTCLATAIYYEAANEPLDGQRAVAQVILNRVRHSAFPSTVCGVVYQGADRQGCQFSFACDGAMERAPARRWWDRAQRIAASALNGYVFAPVGLATHYHTYAVTPAWNRSLVMTDAEGAHFFHRWKGWWGTPAAFTDRYAGGEPEPRPVAFAAIRPAGEALAPPAIEPLPTAAPRTPPASETPVIATASDEGHILDKWKDSGKPIR